MRIVVYTVLLNGYDYLFPVPPRKTGKHDVSWVLVSDRKPLRSKGWTFLAVPEVDGVDTATEINRYCKFFPYKLFPDADISVYIDGNVALKRGIGPELEEFISSGADIGLSVSNHRETIQQEARFCRKSARFPEAVSRSIDAQVAEYERRGLPQDHRLYQGRIIFRSHAGSRLGPAMEGWWREFLAHSRRDQISLPYILHSHDLRVKTWDWNPRSEDCFFHVARHRPKWSKLRPEAFIEEMRFSSAVCGGLYRALGPFYRFRASFRRRKYGPPRGRGA